MIKQREIEQIKMLYNSDISPLEIAKTIGKSPGTIYKYINLIKNTTLDSVFGNKKESISPKITPFIEKIDQKIRQGVSNRYKIFQEIRADGYLGSYPLLNSYINTQIEKIFEKNTKIYKRVETNPGEQAQVDWGHFGNINIDSKDVKLYVFIYTLSYSRAMYAEFTTSQRQNILQNCHINAFRSLGIPKKIRYDNMKTVVISRTKLSSGKHNIVYNFDFSNFARYYKFELDVCPPYYPRSKGKVEAGVKYIRYNFMQGEKSGKTFKSLGEINEKLSYWLKNYANNRIHSTTKEKPSERWEKEKPSLSFIENYPEYKNYITQSRYSSASSMVTYKKSAYWVPEKYARKKIDIVEEHTSGRTRLIFYYKGLKIVEHLMTDKHGDWILPDRSGKNKETGKKITEKKLQQNPLYSIEVEVRSANYYDQFIN